MYAQCKGVQRKLIEQSRQRNSQKCAFVSKRSGKLVAMHDFLYVLHIVLVCSTHSVCPWLVEINNVI